MASADLEAFVDEAIRLGAGRGYHPTVFIGMRNNHGTVSAISKLVQTGDIQSGFKKLNELGLRDWTIEAAVLKFSNEFSVDDIKCATWRLEQL